MKDDIARTVDDTFSFLGPNAAELTEAAMSAAVMNRRKFLLLTGFSGLAIGMVGFGTAAKAASPGHKDNSHDARINSYVHIDTDGRIVIFAPNPEIGQGVKTSLPMIVAEELDADWQHVHIEFAAIDPRIYGMQVAGSSRSVFSRWAELRKMGAMARAMLLQAAATQLGVTEAELETANSEVIHKSSARAVRYADLATAAASMPVPDDSVLVYKKPADYRILGKRITNTDAEAIARGLPLYGIDVIVPDMVYATYVKCPSIGGKPKSANLEEIKQMPGVVDAFLLDGTRNIPTFDPVGDQVSPGVAIVAKSTWQAFKARAKLKVEWDLSTASTDDSDQISKQARAMAAEPGGKILVDKGNVESAFSSADSTLESFYSTRFLSHAQLEPENCTVFYQGDEIEAWAPSQTPPAVAAGIVKLLGIAPDKVTVHQVRAGGGFGRRLENDYAREAALISKHVAAPVKLQWMREDDMAFDYYRPPAYYSFKGALTGGRLTAWRTHVVSVSADGKTPNRDANYPKIFFPEKVLPNYKVTNSMVHSQTPTGPMRAPISNSYAFAEQSFIHELAVAAKRDHLEFLVETLGKPQWTDEGNADAINTGRAIDVINMVGINAGWGRSLPQGRALGLSFYFSHRSHVAEIAEVSVEDENRVKIHKVWVVADIGPVINLSGAEGQCQGSVIDGISMMARQQISIKQGRIEQTNFHQYPLLKMGQRPEIDVQFLQTDNIPTGMGEPALPPVAAAVCNAVYAVTGKRIRNLPIINEGFEIV
jgi:isoquinoline 1-oxidoreductase beta subunit